MNGKLKSLCLSSSLALSFLMVKPVMADEWNKRTEFQFSVPVEIPGTVLAPGKYVFQLADSTADRNIVRVFSEDSEGRESLVTTIMAIPDYVTETETPDKPIIHFEERHSGTPEAIHSWFYPGDDTGWEFVYPKGHDLEASTKTTAAPAPVATADAPSLAPAPASPRVQESEPAAELAVIEEEILVAQNDAPAPPPTQETDAQGSADRSLPETAGYSGLQLITGLVMFCGGIATVFASRRKSLA